ncbi:efflux transporter outer membrane subunit [Sphingobium sp.]|uniref:efflux transporter outer membrane subunit n=1 Tax=Sphingobium sp. TaxID=1912891 RepID=UPI002CF85F9E|nr:efflux transporter outer membrane subunit [Sphingobium sp.]HUD91914.1 efflux transporter outer membrane subunit [Sphingobium sp.]
MTRNFIALLLGASALTACAAGPDYKAPATPTTAAAPFIGAANPAVAQAPADDHWWRLYNDPLLDGLVKDALSANTDIRVAVARLERARAQLRGARSDRLPSTTLSGSPTYGRASQAQTLPGMDRENWTVDMGLDVAYEVDLFGRVKRSIEAARGDAGAAQADADAVKVAVVADTVRAYVDATASAQRIAVAQRTVDLLDQSLRIAQARFDVGRSDRLDVIRITSLRDQQRALIPSLVADRNAALFRLATLTGRTPQDLPATVRDAKVTPDLSQPIPVGDGQALLARRPDVRAAEQRLAGDTARIGVATAALYPRITLGGSISTTAIGGGDIFGGGPLNWLLGPLISWAFPNQEANRARIAAARADGDAALATFDGTVLRALEETETALSTYANALQRRAALQTARDEAARAARISTARQREGQIDFLTVLDALRTQAAADADLAAANRAVAFAQVDLFRALGGGWTII